MVIVLGLLGVLAVDDRLLVAFLPVFAYCCFLVLYFGLVFWNPELDTYANRIGLFWAWFNGAMLINIYQAFMAVNVSPEFYNTSWPECLDKTGNIYSAEFVECFEETAGMKWMELVFATAFDLWVACELYKWALWKYEDTDDETVTRAMEHPTCCAIIPLNNMTIAGFNSLLAFTGVLTIIEGLTVADGELIKPVAFPVAGLIIFNIIAYVVLCSRRRNTRQGRMTVFWAWLICIVIYSRIAYIVVSFIPVSWNLTYLSCVDEHPRGMDACLMEHGQAILFDNVLGVYFDVYFATKLYQWANRA